MACPLCGCEQFYVKNPDDEYENCEFDLKNGQVLFASEEDESWRPELTEATVRRRVALLRRAGFDILGTGEGFILTEQSSNFLTSILRER